MDLITKTPGLIHIAEEIFSNLDRKSLLECQNVNEHWGSILRNPWFWFRRMEQYAKLSEEHQKEWKDFCEKLSKLNLTTDMIPPLNYIYSQLEDSVTLDGTYWNAIRLTEHSSGESEIVRIMASSNLSIEYSGCNAPIEIVRFMAPLIGNPKVENEFGESPIHYATHRGHTEIVKILAHLTEDPNAPDKSGGTPIYWAARWGHTEIVKILAPLTTNPNAPDVHGCTAIYWAAYKGHTEIVKILAPLTDNPNARDNYGKTPIYWAAQNGHLEMVKLLAPLTDNPNAGAYGKTPIQLAAQNGHTEIRKTLMQAKKFRNFFKEKNTKRCK